MEFSINRDYFDNPIPPKLFLCQTDKEIIGQLKSYGVSGNFKWNTYSELSFSINRNYVDTITGENKIDPLFELIECPRLIQMGEGNSAMYFQIQDVETDYADHDVKNITAFSAEYSLSTRYLESFEINTGSDSSAEVTHHASINGDDYWNQDNYYKLAGTTFDPYTRYYIKDYTDNDSYVYSEVQILDADTFSQYNGSTVATTLYVKSFPNVSLYNPTTPQLSLLHLVLSKAPEWSIGSVDYSLWKQERSFTIDRQSVYDFLMTDVSDAFKCVIEFNTYNNTINVYEEAEDGLLEDNTIQSRFQTDVFISKENLANEINVKYSADQIRTKLKVTGGDDSVNIREVNLGSDYIMNLDYYHTVDWMGQELYSKYAQYKTLLENTAPQYVEATKRWVGAYNIWNDLMNAVPAEGNVLLVGDPFEKLYCTYVPVDSQSSSIDTARASLTQWLDIYHVKDDTQANKSDNVLLTLKDADGNSATIRVYYNGSSYIVKRLVTNASTGVISTLEYTLNQWVTGVLTATYMQLSAYKIASIGTLGAYLCLTKDETVKENLQDYGINLLEEKQKTYMLIFQTQTEELFSDEKYQCVASTTVPTGEIPNGTRWLDTDSSPTKLYVRNSASTTGEYSGWDIYDISDDRANYEDYARYIENYNKLQAVQEVLIEKKKSAEMYLNGIQIEGVYLKEGQRTSSNFRTAANQYFGLAPTNWSFDANSLSATFTITKGGVSTNYAIYLNGNVPYVAYENSQGASLAQMNYLKSVTNMETYFTEGEWMRLSAFIREDEFSDSNVALTGYESEEERLSLCNELVELAKKELKTLSQPSLEFSMTMANILALPEFAPIKNQFKLGNFVRIGLPNNMIKRARLLECNINFDDLSDFSCTFGNLVTTKSEIDLHAELLSQAIQAGKTVASSANNWQKAVDKANSIDEAISGGLRNAALEVGAASNQAIRWDENGILLRKRIEGQQDAYEDEQILLTNNKIVGTADKWQTAKSAFGKYTVDGTTYWGVIAEAMHAGYIEGSRIEGGSLKIGTGNTFFQVNENGSVSIMSGGKAAYADAEVVAEIEAARQYHTQITYNGSTVFNEPNQSTTLTCKIYAWDEDITSQVLSTATFAWKRNSRNSTDDTTWNNNSAHTKIGVNTITVTNDDINQNAQFYCDCTFDDTLLQGGGT